MPGGACGNIRRRAPDPICSFLPRVRRAVVELKKLHADRIKAAMRDPTELEMRIDAMTRDITSKFTGAGKRLRNIAGAGGTMADKKTSEMSIKTNIQRSLATSLQDMSSDFRKMQRRYLAEVNRAKKASSFDALIGPSAASAAGDADAGDVDTVSELMG